MKHNEQYRSILRVRQDDAILAELEEEVGSLAAYLESKGRTDLADIVVNAFDSLAHLCADRWSHGLVETSYDDLVAIFNATERLVTA